MLKTQLGMIHSAIKREAAKRGQCYSVAYTDTTLSMALGTYSIVPPADNLKYSLTIKFRRTPATISDAELPVVGPTSSSLEEIKL